ncbi:MAG TPA: TolC family outer membrane protein [Rudaea sp.]
MQKKNRMQILAAAVAMVCASLGHAEDLIQIYQQARQADPTLAIADANKGAVGENVAQARSFLLPQIGASVSYNRNDTSINGVSPQQVLIGDTTNYVLVPNNSVNKDRSRPAQIELSQSIFNWTNWERLRVSRSQAASASADYDSASQALFVRTANAYFAVLTAQDQLVFAQANEKALARQLDQAEQRFQVGLSAITDVHEARANHDSAVAQVIQAQNNVDNAREAVIQIIGKDFGELKKLRDQLPLEKPSPADLQSWVDLAVKQSPTIASAQFSLEAAEHNVGLQRSGHYPTLSASVTRSDTPAWGTSRQFIGLPDVGSVGPFHSNSVTGDTLIGVTLNIPIFTGGLVSSQVRQAVYQRDEAQDQLELQKRQVVANTRNAYRAVIAGISEVEATRQAVISAQSSLEATQAGFEVGTRTIVDVLLSQQTLFQAQSNYSQARHQFVLSGLQLKQSAGTIEGKDLEAVNALLE